MYNPLASWYKHFSTLPQGEAKKTLIRYVMITFKISETQPLSVIETVLNHCYV